MANQSLFVALVLSAAAAGVTEGTRGSDRSCQDGSETSLLATGWEMENSGHKQHHHDKASQQWRLDEDHYTGFRADMMKEGSHGKSHRAKTGRYAEDECPMGSDKHAKYGKSVWEKKAAAYKSLQGGEKYFRGRRQSPVDIVPSSSTQRVNSKSLNVGYPLSTQRIKMVNHDAEVAIEGQLLGLRYWGGEYTSEGLHIHHPSEHTVNGVHADAEMHVVCGREDGKEYAVISILFDIGSENECLASVLSRRLEADCTRPLYDFGLDCFSEELAGPYWSYDGSLSTPPYTENINWIIMHRRATISKAQFEVVASMSPECSRPVQPLHGRMVQANLVTTPLGKNMHRQ